MAYPAGHLQAHRAPVVQMQAHVCTEIICRPSAPPPAAPVEVVGLELQGRKVAKLLVARAQPERVALVLWGDSAGAARHAFVGSSAATWCRNRGKRR